MAETVCMPKTGMLMTMGTVLKWYVTEGRQIRKGEHIAQIETDKAVMDLETTHSGTVLKLIYPAGSRVPVTQPIAWIGEAGEAVPATTPVVLQPLKVSIPTTTAAETINQKPVTAAILQNQIPATPSARKAAAELGIPLETLPRRHSGPVHFRDVLLAAVSGYRIHSCYEDIAALSSGDIRQQLTGIELATAERIVAGYHEIPSAFCSMEADITALLALRNSLYDEQHIETTVNDWCTAALAYALVKHPRFNSCFASEHLVIRGSVNIGIAVKGSNGLIVPVLHNSPDLDLPEIASRLHTLVSAARAGTISPEQLQGATITLTNLGPYGISSFSQIITPPQTAVVGVCASARKLIPDSAGNAVTRDILPLVITYDHRAGDGADAALLLHSMRDFLEHPELLVNYHEE